MSDLVQQVHDAWKEKGFPYYPKDENRRKNIINKLKTDGKSGWHSFDIWLAWNYHDTVTLLTSKEQLAYQLEGYSVLDYNEDNLNVKK